MEFWNVTEVPQSFLLWSGVVAVSAVMQRQVWFTLRRDELWYPSFYVLLLAPPAVGRKSTAVSMARGVVRLVDERSGFVTAETSSILPNAGTWQRLVEEIELRKHERGSNQWTGGTLFTGEIASFFRPGDDEGSAFLCELWDGWQGLWNRAIVRGPAKPYNPYLSILAGVHPFWLSSYMSRVWTQMGLASRVLWAFAARKPRLVPYPDDDTPERALAYKNLVDRLYELRRDVVGAFGLSREARRLGEALYVERIAKEQETRHDLPLGYLERKQNILHRLALVCCLSRRGGPDTGLIDAEDLQRAWDMLAQQEEAQRIALSHIGVTTTGECVRAVRTLVQDKREITLSAIVRQLIHRYDPQVIFDAVSVMELCGDLTIRGTEQRSGMRYADKVYAVQHKAGRS